MEWIKLLCAKRLGTEEWKSLERPEDRSQFQRDFDRIIFSSPFRRMQNKTQVFPLPRHIFVHNRLTHSLEVASVGRSLGNLLAEKLAPKNPENPFIQEIGTIVSTACLAHDLGNPPFGHSGEAAISNFFIKGAGKQFQTKLSKGEWKDFTHFDGNANAFRILTHQFEGKRPGGFALTYSTLATLVKYPFESVVATKQKFGYFQTEKDSYQQIIAELQIPSESHNPMYHYRHPLVYLVEAADDICYQIMDLEDACKLGILGYEEVTNLYLNFFDKPELNKIKETIHKVTDNNEQISYLRALVIGRLIRLSMLVFEKHEEKIMEGSFKGNLVDLLENAQDKAMNQVKKISALKIYNHRSVVEIEIAGYKIIDTLLEEFVGAVIDPKDNYNKKILSLLPDQYKKQKNGSLYLQIQSAVDFISGMTDVFALDLYRKIKGISLPGMI